MVTSESYALPCQWEDKSRETTEKWIDNIKDEMETKNI